MAENTLKKYAKVDKEGVSLYGTRRAVVTASVSPYVATTSDDIILVDASGGAKSVTLPAAVTSLVGKSYTIINTGGTNNVTANRTGSDAIGSGTSATTGTTAFNTITLVCTGAAQWVKIASA